MHLLKNTLIGCLEVENKIEVLKKNMNNARVLKYPIAGEGVVNSIICRKYRLLDIQLQRDELVCWIETREECPETTTKLISVGTGWEVPSEILDKGFYFKTVQDAYGFVWHFYEIKSE